MPRAACLGRTSNSGRPCSQDSEAQLYGQGTARRHVQVRSSQRRSRHGFSPSRKEICDVLMAAAMCICLQTALTIRTASSTRASFLQRPRLLFAVRYSLAPHCLCLESRRDRVVCSTCHRLIIQYCVSFSHSRPCCNVWSAIPWVAPLWSILVFASSRLRFATPSVCQPLAVTQARSPIHIPVASLARLRTDTSSLLSTISLIPTHSASPTL